MQRGMQQVSCRSMKCLMGWHGHLREEDISKHTHGFFRSVKDVHVSVYAIAIGSHHEAVFSAPPIASSSTCVFAETNEASCEDDAVLDAPLSSAAPPPS